MFSNDVLRCGRCNDESERTMTDAQLKELADLRVAIQDLKYQLIHKHRELSDAEIINCMDKADPDINEMIEFARKVLRKARND